MNKYSSDSEPWRQNWHKCENQPCGGEEWKEEEGKKKKTAGWLTVKSQSFSRSRKRGTRVSELVSVKEGEVEEKKGDGGGEEGQQR